MLELSGISKKYKTGAFIQTALDGVDLTLRDNEFVAILGPSGSGKTTLLNIIGGLDRYDEGDLVINGRSTKDYKDRDWDTYRNHTIGFVFQSYNLIPHQSVLDNVTLALTIGGVSGGKRKEMALKALEQVGLLEHAHKKPNQLSGGQMQRVAIARALVNNPDIVLADEPTGALDTETGIQVMELLKEVAKDRLVVMVTHNPELADTYATRIINIKDGKIIEDSRPVEAGEIKAKEADTGKVKKAGMKFPTSFKLSLNNLRTKFGRTLLTAIAGSIGIIGIALILAMSNGVNDYIYNIQHDTMASYPLTINSSEFDMTQVLDADGSFSMDTSSGDRNRSGLYADTADLDFGSGGASYKTNNLAEFKKYLDNPDSEIHKYLGENGVTYSYKTAFTVYSQDSDGAYVDTNDDPGESRVSMLRNLFGGGAFRNSTSAESAKNFYEMAPGKDGEPVSDMIKDNYELVAGEWPTEATDVVVVLAEDNSLTAEALYQLGVITMSEYNDLSDQAKEGQLEKKLSDGYELLLNREFYLVPQSRYYEKKENGTFGEREADLMSIKGYVDDSIRLKVSGVVKPGADLSTTLIDGLAGYTSALTDLVVKETDESEVVKAQEASPDINVLTGVEFYAADNAAKARDAKEYAQNLSVADKASMYQMILLYRSTQGEDEAQSEEDKRLEEQMQQQMQAQAAAGNQMSEEQMLAMYLDTWLASDPKEEDLVKLYDNYIGSTSYDANMESFGKVNKDAPSAINIYTDTFEDKDAMKECIAAYNNGVEEKDKITYNDIIGILTSSMTRIVNVLTAVLVGFVSVSLIVSSIMIGIITHISVLERTKEIGILRAMGASKGNIAQVFNAETILIGLASGLIGVGVAVALTFPMTSIMRTAMEGAENVRAFISPLQGAILIGLSMVITFIGGIIPSRKAANKDPVTALRSE